MAKVKKQEAVVNKRPPIVTIMGHVDHGKTSLLDSIRKSNVAAKEKGGITQAISSYQIEVATKEGPQKITFIDTPGHAAFSKMRSRGAKITDIVILVVSADDGVMPQTKESIAHIKEAKVPYIVAINKIDLPTANAERIKKQLSENDCLVEEYGGDIVAIPVSAKTGQGLDTLLEMVLLVAEMSNLKDDVDKPFEATVIESQVDPHKGPIATIIIRNGNLKIGDQVLIEGAKGKIRAMLSDKGENLKEANASMPVIILGLENVPDVGCLVEKEAQKQKNQLAKSEDKSLSLSEQKSLEISPDKQNIILRADYEGSLEAIIPSLPGDVNVVVSGTGEVTESDILLARSSKSIIIGFNCKTSPHINKLAEEEKVIIRNYNIIYELLEELEEVVKIIPEKPEEIKGEAQIIAEFPYENKRVAGSRITKGVIGRSDFIRVERKGETIGTSKVKSIRLSKTEIPKVEIGKECGILLDPSVDFLVGDMLISIKQKA